MYALPISTRRYPVHPDVIPNREAREEAEAWAVVATGSASVDVDYDNGTPV